MKSINLKVSSIQELPNNYTAVLSELLKQISQKVLDQREIMYSDIINIILRNGYYGEVYNHIIIWCNFNIRNGNYTVQQSIET